MNRLLLSTFSAIIAISPAMMAAHCSAQPEVPSRIVNGGPEPEGAWPWMAAIVDAANPTSIFCGAEIVHPRYALTAAHCAELIQKYPDSFKVVTGRNRLTSTSGIATEVEGAVLYPLYNSSTTEHDIALVKLKSPVPGAVAQLLTPAESILASAGTYAKILGWGTMDADWPAFPDTLQGASVPIWADGTCEQVYGIAFKPGSMLCAGKVASTSISGDGIDSCNGDSGGPLAVSDGKGNWKIAGLTSWGFSCAGHRYPGVYSEVAPYSAWVYTFPPIPAGFRDGAAVLGDASVGNTLTCDSGVLLGDQPIALTYQWSRFPSKDGYPDYENPSDIPGAISKTYTVTNDDANAYLFCTIHGTNAGGSSDSISYEVGPVFAPDPTPVPEPSFTPTPLPTPEPTPSPTATPMDSGAPKAKFSGATKSPESYEVRIDADDDLGATNVSRVEAVALRTYVTKCKSKNGKSKPCKKSASEFFLANNMGGTTWSFLLPRRTQNNRYKMYIRAADYAGNLQDPPLRLTVDVKKK